MVECAKCHETGLKIRDTVAAYVAGKSVFYCKKCAKEEIGEQNPEVYFKKPRDE